MIGVRKLMLIKAETKEKKEKVLQFNKEMNKSFYKTGYKSVEGPIVSAANELFNNINLNKYEAYMLINKVEDLSAYIPNIQKVKSYNQIIKFAQKYEKVILRPIDFSISRPLYFIEAIDNCIIITNNTKLQSEKKIIHSESELKEFLQLNKVSLDTCFVQKSIKFIRLGELTYDIRICMRSKMGIHWRCSSLQCMFGKNKIIINKISDKYKEIYFKNALKRSLPIGCKQDDLIKQINIICQKACNILGQNNPGLFEYEFDIAIDKEKKIWITDISVLKSYKGFKQIDSKTYFSRKYAPILYDTPTNNFKYK